MHASRTGAAVAAVLTLGLSACGGGKSDKLSKADLTSKANAICSTAQTSSKAIAPPSDISDASQASAYFDKVAPITDKETSDLDALSPADDVKDDWNAFIAKQDSANKLLQTIKDKADKKDPSGLQDLSKVTGVGQQVSSAAKKVGATRCG